MVDFSTILIDSLTVEDMLVILGAVFSLYRGFDHGFLVMRVR